jgi:hypothetical protein
MRTTWKILTLILPLFRIRNVLHTFFFHGFHAKTNLVVFLFFCSTFTIGAFTSVCKCVSKKYNKNTNQVFFLISKLPLLWVGFEYDSGSVRMMTDSGGLKIDGSGSGTLAPTLYFAISSSWQSVRTLPHKLVAIRNFCNKLFTNETRCYS